MSSHVKIKDPDGRIIIFLFHDKVDRITLKGALRDAEVEMNEFVENIK